GGHAGGADPMVGPGWGQSEAIRFPALGSASDGCLSGLLLAVLRRMGMARRHGSGSPPPVSRGRDSGKELVLGHGGRRAGSGLGGMAAVGVEPNGPVASNSRAGFVFLPAVHD